MEKDVDLEVAKMLQDVRAELDKTVSEGTLKDDEAD